MKDQLIWAAGFFDGEGNIGYYRCGRRYGKVRRRLQIQITQAHPGVLKRFRDAVRIGRVRIRGARRNPAQQPQWVYETSDQPARQVIGAIMPWLSSQKRRQAKQALARAG